MIMFRSKHVMLPEAEKCCQEALKTAGDAQDDEKKWNILQTTAEVKLTSSLLFSVGGKTL